jgi:hypothetical protein
MEAPKKPVIQYVSPDVSRIVMADALFRSSALRRAASGVTRGISDSRGIIMTCVKGAFDEPGCDIRLHE